MVDLRTFARHQMGAAFATVVDFGTMIACVRLLGLSPVLGTALGAAFGGVSNFLLGRQWIFHAGAGALRGQALRYAMVSGASLGLNTLGEYLLSIVAGVQYVVARLAVAVLVSFLWNFPMQRAFVFRVRTEAP